MAIDGTRAIRPLSKKIVSVLIVLMTAQLLARGGLAPLGLATEEPAVADQLIDDGLITLNFYEVDIREVLAALAMKRDINLVMAQEVVGKVSLHLSRVTLDQALDAITLAGGAAYIKHGTTYHVYKPKEDKDPQAGRLQMRIFRLKYAKTEKIQDILDAIPGKRLIKFHEPSKAVIVEDTPENVMKIETIVRFLDKKPRQVMIEAKILKIDLTDDMSLGINWEQLLGDARIATGGFTTAISATAQGVSPVPAGGTGAFANMMTGVGSRHQFTAALSALQTKTKVDILSTPKILAIHGEPAKVQVGGQQGYKVTNVTGTGIATESVLFIDTGTILEITPYIDDEDNVLLYVKPSINSATIDETGIPSVVSTAVSTWLLAKSGETVFIAGLIEDTGIKTRGMIPCIGNIPWLGWLFRRTSRNIGKSEFLVLISPSVIQTGQESVDKMAIEKVKKLEEAFERAPLPPDRELLDSPWPRE